MNFTELFIRRPVMTVLLSASFVVAGILAYGGIPIAARVSARASARSATVSVSPGSGSDSPNPGVSKAKQVKRSATKAISGRTNEEFAGDE